MKKSFIFLLPILFLLFICYSTSAQVDTQFWFAPPDVTNGHAHSDEYIEVRIASVSSVADTVKLSQPANPGNQINLIPAVIIPPGQSYTFNLATRYYPTIKADLETSPDGTVKKTGLLITSTGPITAYYEVGRSASVPNSPDPEHNGEIFTLKGRNALGTHFFTPFQNIYENKLNGTSSIDMVATQDNTTIKFKLTKPGISGGINYAAGTTYTIVLNKGETYSVKAAGTQGADHLSGSEITSDKPIAITQKDDSVTAPWNNAIDIIGDQLVPVNVVGTEYYVVRGFLGTGSGNPPFDKNEVFIVPTQDGTNIQVDGNNLATNATAGSLVTYTLSGAGGNSVLANKITSDKPIYVYYVSGSGGEMGGPLLPPIKCTGSSKVTFVRSSPDPFYLTILVKTVSIGKFLVQGRNDIIVAGDFTAIDNEWSVAQKRMDNPSLSPNGIPVNLGVTIENTSGYFHLGIINGKTNDGTSRFAYFSDYAKTVSQLPSSISVCPGNTVLLDPKVVGLDSAKTQWYQLPGNTLVYTGSKYNAPAGTYRISLVDLRNCVLIDTLQVKVNTLTPFDLGNATSTVCFNVPKPITVPGSVPGTWKKVQWTTTPLGVSIPDDTSRWDPIKTGKYAVTVTDNNGCKQNDAVDVTFDNSLQNFDLGPSSSTVCFNAANPIVVPSGSYSSIVWTAPSSIIIPDGTTSYNPTASGTYKVTVTNAAGCSNSDQVVVTFDNKLQGFDLGADNSTVCFNVSKPIVVPAGSYSSLTWTAPSTITIANGTMSYDPKVSGTYKVTVTDALGCSASDQVVVNYDDGLKNFDLGPANSTVCFNVSKPIVVPSGTYSNVVWTAPSPITIPNNTMSYDPKANGTYQVTVTDAAGCSATDQVAVIYNNGLQGFDLGPATSTVCSNVSKPIIVPTGNYGSVVWSAPVTIPNGTMSYDPKVSGTYKVTVTDAAGCSNNDEVAVTYADGLKNFDLGAGNSTVCFNVSKPIVVSGGPYNSIVWTAPITIPNNTTSFDPKVSGTYQVKVGDAFGCFASDQVDVTYSDGLKDFDLGPPNSTVCFNVSNPIVVSGAPYNSIKWLAPSPIIIADGTLNYDPKTTGIYKVTVGDAFGCFATDQVNVTYDNSLQGFDLGPSASTVCFNISKPIVVNGSYPTIKWTAPAPVTIADGTVSYNPVASGTYKVTVSNASGCSASDQVVVDYHDGLKNFNLTSTPTVCFNVNSPIVATGGPFETVKWTAPAGVTIKDGTTTYNPVKSGTYKVTVGDGFGCSAFKSTTITYVPSFNLDLGTKIEACSYTGFVINATKPNIVSYEWATDVLSRKGGMPGTTMSTYTPDTSGHYSVKLTDINGCTDQDTLSFQLVLALTLDLGPDRVACEYENYVIDATGNYGKYVWTNDAGLPNPGTTESKFVPSTSGTHTYSVTVTDKSGNCNATDAVKITSVPNFNFQLNKNADTVCFSQPKAIQAKDSRFNTGYTWSWKVPVNETDPLKATSFLPTKTGIYEVTVKDINNCIGQDAVKITISPLPSGFNLGPPKDTVCFNMPDTIRAVNPEFNKGVTWSWTVPENVINPGADTMLVVGKSGLYKVTITDRYKCQASDQVDITFSDSTLAFDLGDPLDTVCFNVPVQIKATNPKYNTGYTWTWTVPPGAANPGGATMVYPDTSGIYKATVRDRYLCENSDNVMVRFSKGPSGFDLGSPLDTICAFMQDTIMAVDPRFNNGFVWTWTVPQNTPDPKNAVFVIPQKNGIYKVVITDSYKCSAQDQVEVKISDGISGFDLGNPVDTVCFNVPYPIQATDPKFKSGYTWTWQVPQGSDNPNGKTSFVPVIGGLYKVVVEDSLKCKYTDQVLIQYSNALDSFNLGAPQAVFCDKLSKLIGATNTKFNNDSYTWHWSVPAGALNPGKATNTLPLIEGNYMATVTDSLLCQVSDQVSVSFLPPVKLDLGSDTTACSYGNYTINAGGGYTSYLWNVAGVTTSTYKPTSTGTYWVEATNAGGCKARDTVKVIYIPPINVSLGKDLTICFRNPHIALSPGKTYSSYLWPDGSTNSSYIPPFPKSDQVMVSQQIWVKVKKDICEASDVITVTFVNPRKISIGPDTTVCPGNPVTLQAPPGLTAYYWYDLNSEVPVSTERSFTVNNNKDVTYRLVISGGCADTSLSKRVSYYTKPSASLRYIISKEPQDTILSKGFMNFCVGETLTLLPDSINPGYQYLWTVKPNDSPTAASSLVIDDDALIYYKVIDDHGCFASDSVIAVTNDSCFFIPNLFTPNEDKFNASFHIQGIRLKQWHLEIYNRWGDQVYINPAYSNEWKAENVSDGVYFYQLKHPEKHKSYKGWVQVVR